MNSLIDLRDGKDAPKAKREDGKCPRRSATCALRCLGATSWWDPVATVALRDTPLQLPGALPVSRALSDRVCPPPHSHRPAVLEGRQADGDSVWELPAAALLPDPVQRRQRRGLPGSRRALSHHQLPHLQVGFTSCAEDRRGSPFQVSERPTSPCPASIQPLSRL